jgi:hypothetical protein
VENAIISGFLKQGLGTFKLCMLKFYNVKTVIQISSACKHLFVNWGGEKNALLNKQRLQSHFILKSLHN